VTEPDSDTEISIVNTEDVSWSYCTKRGVLSLVRLVVDWVLEILQTITVASKDNHAADEVVGHGAFAE
jgi:hypothetical protein